MAEAGLQHELLEAAELLLHVPQPGLQGGVLVGQLFQHRVRSVQLRLLLLPVAEGRRSVLRLLTLRLVPREKVCG